MIRRDVVVKLTKLMKRWESERGPFILFGVFGSEGGAPDDVDLVVSAPWWPSSDYAMLGKIIDELKDEFTEGMLSIAAVVPVDSDSPFLHAVLDTVGNVRRPIHQTGCNLFGLPVTEAYIWKARRIPAPDSPYLRGTEVLPV